MATPINIKVIVGSVREGRFADRGAKWIADEVAKHDGVTVEVLDLVDYPMPFFNEAVSPSFKSEPYKNEVVAKWTSKIGEGDAFIIVTPEYNHSTSGVLKNAMDWVYPEWNNKAVGFMSYGSVGGARAIEHLRLIAVELQMAPIREAIHIPGDQYFGALFGNGDFTAVFEHLNPKVESMTKQLLWWARALKSAK